MLFFVGFSYFPFWDPPGSLPVDSLCSPEPRHCQPVVDGACLLSRARPKQCFFLLFLPVILHPELFKKLRETPGNNFHQVSYKSEPGCPSYDEKQKKVQIVLILTVLVLTVLVLTVLVLVKNLVKNPPLITRSQELRFGRNLVEIVPRSLPQLSKQLTARKNDQRTRKIDREISRVCLSRLLRPDF